MVVSSATIDSLFKEKEQYRSSAAFRKAARLRDNSFYEEGAKDPEAFWARMAKELEWIAPWSQVLDWKPPFAKWFVGGRINVAANCLDRHLNGPRRNQAAIVWEGEPGDRRAIKYCELYDACRFAIGFRSLGVGKGGRSRSTCRLSPRSSSRCLRARGRGLRPPKGPRGA